MKAYLSLLFSLVAPATFYGQMNYELIQSIPLKAADVFTVDQFANIYIVNNTELLKLDRNGKEIYSFSEPILGDIHQVNVLNPMNPYIFYKDVNRLLVVDNRLNQDSELNFAEYGFLDVQFISFSDQENVWFYDQATDKIYRFNIRKKQQTNRSLNITQIIGEENEPAGMVSTVDNVFLNVPEKGIFVFDAVGAYKKTIPLTDISAFDIQGKMLFASRGKEVMLYNIENGRLHNVLSSARNVTNIEFENGLLYIFDGSALKIFKPRMAKDNE